MIKEISFKSDEFILSGVLATPDAATDKIAILCHGFTSNKKTSKYIELTDRLIKNGIATFRFDFFGHGESEGDFAEITVSKAVQNILDAISFVKTERYSKIGLLGSSFGGGASTVATSKIIGLKALVLISPACDYLEVESIRKTKEEIQEWQKNGYTAHINSTGKSFKLNYLFLEDAIKNCPFNFAKEIKIPTLIIHGDNDNIVPIGQSQHLNKLIKNSKLQVISSADHLYSNHLHNMHLLEITESFFIRELND
jgi:esterase/lipase